MFLDQNLIHLSNEIINNFYKLFKIEENLEKEE